MPFVGAPTPEPSEEEPRKAAGVWEKVWRGGRAWVPREWLLTPEELKSDQATLWLGLDTGGLE